MIVSTFSLFSKTDRPEHAAVAQFEEQERDAQLAAMDVGISSHISCVIY